MRTLGARLGNFINRVSETEQAVIEKTTSARLAGAEVGRQLALLRARLRAAAAELDAITPPADVRAAHAQLRHGILEYAQELTGIISQLRAGNFRGLVEASRLKGIKVMERASAEITRKGYAIVDASR